MIASAAFLRSGYRNIFFLSKALKTLKPLSKTEAKSAILLSKTPAIPAKSGISDDASIKEAYSLAEIILDNDSSKDEYCENKKEVLKVLKYLLSRGCTIHDIKEKCIDYIDPSNNSYLKAKLISELHPDMSILLPLMSLSLPSLRKAAKQARDDTSEIVDFPNRIAYLSHHLEVSPAQLVSALSKHSSLLTMRFPRLALRMNILKNANIGPEFILKDLWIFNYNEHLMGCRVSAAAEAGVQIKPWMLRCSESTFESVLVKYGSAKKILGEDDQITYLAKKLECDKDYVKYMMDKNKLLKAINIPKLEKVLSFLYEKGYTPQEIRLSPRIFCSSVKSLEKRFQEAMLIRNTLPTISQLCISSERFKQHMEKQIPKENN